MQLTPGTKLAEYEILSSIGVGGMGEVHKARDTKLGREVAIKVLPEAFAQDKKRLARFEREARLLASLNHPNIATIHDLEESDGIRFLVMELVEGETLAERIKRGPIPVDEALPLFKQIAEGLEAAHEKGVIHRDLKPANVKITPDGGIKILDFGLAKAMAGEAPDQALSESPTMTRGATEAGVLLGTAPYMSPEQARGKAVDKRTDIWAFGCCLYEALAGKPAFLGETVSDTIARVLERKPDWQLLPNDLPPLIHSLMRRCLKKDPERRLRDVADAGIELEEAVAEYPELAHAKEKRRGSRSHFVMGLATLAALLVAVWSLMRSSPPEPGLVTRSVILLSPDEELALVLANPAVAISPDGRYLAYVARGGDSTHLYLRAMDELESRVVTSGQGIQMPFFSPDSQWLGFLRTGGIMKAAVNGGAPVSVKQLGTLRGASWDSNLGIVFTLSTNAGLSRISEDGAELEVLTFPNRERREKTHRLPEVLPGGKTILFTLGTGDITSFDDASIAVLALETGEYRVLLAGGTNPRYSPTGHLIYARAGSLMAVPFDVDELEVKGAPVAVLQGVATSPITGSAEYSLSREGSLVYAPGDSWEEENQIAYIDRQGYTQPLIETPRTFRNPRLSPDGLLLACWIDTANPAVWLYDISRGTSTRFAYGFDNLWPVWNPEANHVAFSSTRSGQYNIFWRTADASSDAEQLTSGERAVAPNSISPDGSTLIFDERQGPGGTDLWTLALSGKGEPRPFLQTPFNERWAAFSPDGRWVAYESDESGRYEVYVQPFPGPGPRSQVSTKGGTWPRWNPSGQELFYRNGDLMMVVDIETEGELTLGKPKVLFEKRSVQDDYDVTPDGQRFIMVVSAESKSPPKQLVVVQNWSEELKRLVPINE